MFVSWRSSYGALLESYIQDSECHGIRDRIDDVFKCSGDLYHDCSVSDDPIHARMGAALECLALAFELHSTAAARTERDAAYDLLIGDGLLALAFKLASDIHDDAYRLCGKLARTLIGETDPRHVIRLYLNAPRPAYADSRATNAVEPCNHGGSA